MRYDKDLFKVATKYKHIGEIQVYKPGDIFKKSSTVGYEGVEGLEFTMEDIGKLINVIDDMFYDISNQWENGMDIESFVGVVRDYFYK